MEATDEVVLADQEWGCLHRTCLKIAMVLLSAVSFSLS